MDGMYVPRFEPRSVALALELRLHLLSIDDQRAGAVARDVVYSREYLVGVVAAR